MPIGYNFVAQNGETATLDDVENEYLNEIDGSREVFPAIGDRSMLFEILCITGITCTAHGSFNQETFDKIYKDEPENMRNAAYKYLTVNYKFQSWRYI